MNNDKKMNNSKSDKFNEAYETILKMNGDLNGQDHLYLFDPLIQYSDPERKELKKLKRLYAHVTSLDGKSSLAQLILIRVIHDDIEKGLLIILDNLYSQHKIGNNQIHDILMKRDILADILNLESNECDAIISVMLAFLETPCPEIRNFNDTVKYHDVLTNRLHAAHILGGLINHPKTTQISKETIRKKGDLIVIYDSFEDDRELIGPVDLKTYFN
jgi:hypothetical protein